MPKIPIANNVTPLKKDSAMSIEGIPDAETPITFIHSINANYNRQGYR